MCYEGFLWYSVVWFLCHQNASPHALLSINGGDGRHLAAFGVAVDLHGEALEDTPSLRFYNHETTMLTL